jgi:hypothetical protein
MEKVNTGYCYTVLRSRIHFDAAPAPGKNFDAAPAAHFSGGFRRWRPPRRRQLPARVETAKTTSYGRGKGRHGQAPPR